MKASLPLAALLALALLATPAQAGDKQDFSAWLAAFRAEALSKGLSASTLDGALADVRPIPKVLELDQRQPEFVDTFWNYLDARLGGRQVQAGKDRLWLKRKLLYPIQYRHGVPAALLVALWGMETKYGGFTGGFPVPAALATLAYDSRRAGFFREELLNALRILQEGHVLAKDMKGSWAGAMGQMQFMPSTFLANAVDADGDGRKDIWRSLPDALESGAEYLARLGWQSDELWGREVRLPEGFDYAQATLGNKLPVNQWAALGVTLADGKSLPKSDLPGAILLPQGYAGPAFLVYRNFEVVMGWNRSINYALAALILADRLQGLPPPRLGRDADNRRLSREQVADMQRLLSARGFVTGDPDGVPGSRTREAIRAYQKSAGLPVDGFASATLLEELRQDGARHAQAMPAVN
ncbi:MAG TPA: lytic murein transglycosylase [Thiobacillaceae bacterium]|nr:lytic murein transglycosylase [Thiobacillaceae bacterium]